MDKRTSEEIATLSKSSTYDPPKAPFLRSLRMKNFKSIESCNLDLSPLTILVGRNSSGKSTLIQSILLLAQNASSLDPRGLGDKGILDINGSLITLGQFSELINEVAAESDQYISIGCNFQFPIPSRSRWLEPIFISDEDFRTQDIDLWASSASGDPKLKGCSLNFDTQFEENGDLYEKNLLKSRESHVDFSVNGVKVQEISGARNRDKNLVDEMNIDEKYDQNFSVTVKTYSNLKNRKGVHTDPRSYLVYPNRAETRKLEATRFMLGIPITGLESMNTLDIVIKHQNSLFSRPQAIASEIIRNSRSEFNQENNRTSLLSLPDQVDFLYKEAIDLYARKCFEVAKEIQKVEWGSEELYSIAQELLPCSSLNIPVKRYLDDSPGVNPYFDESLGLLSKEEIASAEAEYDIHLLSHIARDLKPYQMNTTQLGHLRRSISSSIKDFWDKVKARINELKETEDYSFTRLVPTGFALVEDLSDFDEENYENLVVGYGVNKFRDFLGRICYLGPLRKAPTEIYERFSTPGNQQTPLGLEGDRLGQLVFENPIDFYPVPVSELASDDVVTEIKKCNFRDALNAWLRELGIAKTGIASIPESHYGLKVTVDGRPLRSLGVGVSQVIPVIATCLIAGRGSMVLLEEPELHLNPSLQRQLADFFIAMTLSGADRQLIVETHSEYLITRLRVHSVKSREKASRIKLLFASQRNFDSDKNVSIYQELTPDEHGEIPEWPELPGHEDGYFGQVPHDIQQLLKLLVERHKNPDNSN